MHVASQTMTGFFSQNQAQSHTTLALILTPSPRPLNPQQRWDIPRYDDQCWRFTIANINKEDQPNGGVVYSISIFKSNATIYENTNMRLIARKRKLLSRNIFDITNGAMVTSSNGNIFRLLAFCVGNSSVTGEFPAKRPMTQSLHIFCDLRLIYRLSKQSWGWWSETLLRSLWRLSNGCSVLLFESMNGYKKIGL